MALVSFSPGCLSFRSFLRLVPPDELSPKGEEQARCTEAVSMARCDAQLACDLAKGQAKTAKAEHRGEAVKATVALRVCAELVDECELTIPPGSGFGKEAFDKGPRPLELLIRELLGEWPASPWPGVRRQVLGVDEVRAVRTADRRQPSGANVYAKRLDVTPETARRSVQFHQLRRRHGDNRLRFKVSGTFPNGDYVGVKSHAPRWQAMTRPRKRPGVRLGPHYPRHTLVLELALPRFDPMSEQQLARAVEILAEMLADRQREGDSPSNRVVIRRVRV